MSATVLFLPFPPSMNTYWRSMRKGPLAGRVIISARGREYRKEVLGMVKQQFTAPKFMGALRVHVFYAEPDRRIRDLDNYMKAVFDSCTHAGVWSDDHQVKSIGLDWDGVDDLYYDVPATPYELTKGMIALEITALRLRALPS